MTALETVEDLSGKCEGRCVADGALRVSHCRPCIGATWAVRATGRFFCPEAIHLLEARAQIRCAIRCERWYRNRWGYLVGQCGVHIGAEPSPSEELSIAVHCPSILCHRSQHATANVTFGGSPQNGTLLMLHLPPVYDRGKREGKVSVHSRKPGNPADAPPRVHDRGKFEDKKEISFYYQNFIVCTGQTTYDWIIHPASSVQQSYTPTPSVAPLAQSPVLRELVVSMKSMQTTAGRGGHQCLVS